MRAWGTLCLDLVLAFGVVPVLAQAPPCAARQLSATDDGGSAMGSTYLRVTLINVSQVECRLEGPPRIEQYDKSGRRRKLVPEWPERIVSTTEGVRSLVLAPGGRAVFEIQTTNSTGYEPGRDCEVRLTIHPPRSGRSLIDIPVESCGPVRISGYLPAQ